MEDASYDLIFNSGISDGPARTLSMLVAEMPYLLCSVMGADIRVKPNMVIVDGVVFHSVRDFLLSDIVSIPNDYTDAVSGSSPAAAIGRMLLGMMGERVCTLPAPAQEPASSPLTASLLAAGFAVPLFVSQKVLVAVMPNGMIGLYVDYDDDAFPFVSPYSALDRVLASAGLKFGTVRTLLGRVTYRISTDGDADDAWVVGPSVPFKRAPDDDLIDAYVMENAVASDVVDAIRRIDDAAEVYISSYEAEWGDIAAAHGWLFEMSGIDMMASAVASIEHHHGRGTCIIVNPTCMRPIVELLNDVNFSKLSNAALLSQLYPLVTVTLPSKVVPPNIEIVNFEWAQRDRYFARFAQVAPNMVRPASLVSALVIEEPYNNVDILSRFLSRYGNTALYAQLPPIYDGTCAVCLSARLLSSDMLQYDCRHVFCSDCTHSVMSITGSNACPLCRMETQFVRAPLRSSDDLVERVDVSDAIRKMQSFMDDDVVVLSDVPEILAAFPGADVARDFAGNTVLFCGSPGLFDRAMAIRNTFREGAMNVKRFEVKDGFDEFARRFGDHGAVNDQMVAFWAQRTTDPNAIEVQAFIDRFSSINALRAWHGPGFFVHERVLYNPVHHMMKLDGGAYATITTISKMAEFFHR